METPHGYHPTAGGLLVPEALARERQVWTDAERRLLDRCAKLLTAKGVYLQLQCEAPDCQRSVITRIPQAGGGFMLRCAHADRVFMRAF